MNSTERQNSKELKIFSSFAVVSGMQIRPASIQKLKPPEPDILCEVEGTRLVAFEMVEIIDEGLAERTYGQIRMQGLLEKAYGNLPASNPLDAKKSLGNALIHVAFHPHASLLVKKRSIPGILELLNQVTPSFSGQVKVDSQSPLGKTVRKVTVRRGEFEGPCFDVEGMGSFADPLIDKVEDKFSKCYRSSNPIELLAYYELQPEPMDWVWSDLRAFVEDRLSDSGFRRVWVYDHARHEIRFVHPAT